jgi:hypothetical protein
LARAKLAAFALLTIASGICVQVACLPDLDRTPLPAAAEAGPVVLPKNACGDGFIDTTAPAGSLPDGGVAYEECDPGAGGAVAGCTDGCRLTCDGGVVDPRTQHCYFALSPQTHENDAVGACGPFRAHVATFVSDDEVALVRDAGFGSFWVGLSYVSSLAGYQSVEVVNGEPGWNYPSNGPVCAGCYARIDPTSFPYFPPLGPDAATPDPLDCVTSADGGAWTAVPCNSPPPSPQTLCEREPPGSRASVCNGGICVTLAATSKKYIYVPTETAADDARTFCRSLANGNLVLFDTREEREELVRELARFIGPGEEVDFWIGIAAGEGGGFVWDDGKPETARPSAWGFDAGAASTSARAFVSVQGKNPIDQGLAHADPGTSSYPFVCEYGP